VKMESKPSIKESRLLDDFVAEMVSDSCEDAIRCVAVSMYSESTGCERTKSESDTMNTTCSTEATDRNSADDNDVHAGDDLIQQFAEKIVSSCLKESLKRFLLT
jgi:hypothetical protein